MSIRRDLLMRSALLRMPATSPPRATVLAATRLDPPAARREPRKPPVRVAPPAKGLPGPGA
ncbi:hypothetical protein [Roseomonas sp. HF4]|uniref:hypothetical protein n=1 Tax=Roseomonas sp. HF4 TaxID=2562313 RepID=UPI0010C0C9C5|nr:hypothetical protein [Roseomonas sp. HF4]